MSEPTENVTPERTSTERKYAKHVTIVVQENDQPNPKNSYVEPDGKVTLKAAGKQSINVCTYVNKVLTKVFTSGDPPYAATPGGGTDYTLASGIGKKTVIAFENTSSDKCADKPSDDHGQGGGGTNGTINVGG